MERLVSVKFSWLGRKNYAKKEKNFLNRKQRYVKIFYNKNTPPVFHIQKIMLRTKITSLRHLKTSPKCFYSRNSITQPEIEDMKNSTKKLIEKHINPNIPKYEKDMKQPLHEIFKLLGNNGLLGISMPEKYGGLNLPYHVNMDIIYEIGGIRNGSLPMAIGVQTDMSTPALAKYGNDYLKENFLAPAIAGDLVSCIGVSEHHAGSDVANIKTTAKYDAKTDEFVINGGKIWTTNVTQADWMCLIASTDPTSKNIHKNKSLFILPLNLPGITISTQGMEKMGMRASDWGQTYFDNVRIPGNHLIGELNKGFTYQMEQFQFERMVAVAAGIKPLEICIKETIEYCQNRNIFGQPLSKKQNVQFVLAECATEVELLKTMLFATAKELESGKDFTKEASMLKFKLGQMSRVWPDKMLQFWGAQGYLMDNYVNRVHRDGRAGAIGGGADEVMLAYIAKYMGV